MKFVELHLHLDGAVSHETLYEFAKQKNPDLADSAETLKEKLVHSSPCANLTEFLKAFQLFIGLIAGDVDAIERIAYELCQHQSENDVVYFEARYCPHLLANTTTDEEMNFGVYHDKGKVHPEDVVQAVNRGLKRGQTDFNIMARSIMVCFPSKLEVAKDLLEYCVKYKKDGVVGIDIAQIPLDNFSGELSTEIEEIRIFERAKELGIRRTVHAGEAEGPESVDQAIHKFHAERIGHGYRVVQDEPIYQRARQAGVHFECCPWSSYLTNAVNCPWDQHPLNRFMKDDVNFSLSTDDPTVTGTRMKQEVAMVQNKLGWTDDQIKKLQINAAKASFLEDHEIEYVLKLLEQ